MLLATKLCLKSLCPFVQGGLDDIVKGTARLYSTLVLITRGGFTGLKVTSIMYVERTLGIFSFLSTHVSSAGEEKGL